MTNSTARAIRPATCARCGTDLPDTSQTCPACGLSLEAGTIVLAPPVPTHRKANGVTELGPVADALAPEYEVLEELGRGGMAIVYRAHDRALRRDVALKVLPATHALDGEFVDRFQQEARTSAQLEHPHIVPIHRVGTLGSVSFFTMKLLRGGALSDLLRERKILALPEVRRLLREVGSALAYASKQGVVHRDIKPDNIMLDDAGRFVVTDFGIARSAAAPRLTATGMSVGTPRYMSPEQARAKPLDGRSDIYSLGVVAYQCLTGRVPFEGDEAFAILYSHIHSPVPRPPLSSAEEWELFELIERMMAKAPEQRVQSGEELVQLVEQLDARVRAGTVTGSTLAMPVTVASRALLDRAWPEGAFWGQRSLTIARACARRIGVLARSAATASWAAARAVALGAGRHSRIGVRRVAVMGRAVLSRSVPAARDTGLRTLARARALPGGRWVLASWPRATALATLVVLATLGASRAVHAVAHHGSRCPAPAIESRMAADGWSVLLDTPPSRSVGDAVVLHYDVCGMDAGAPYAVELTIARPGGALRRLLGGPSPLVERYDDRARSAASRHHRRIALEGLPAGTYSVELQVSDTGGRKRRASRELRIAE